MARANPMVDITYSNDGEMTEIIFSASTVKGEDWMGAPEVTVPVQEAADYKKAAEEAGLTVAAM